MKRMLFIYNPNAGMGAMKGSLSDIVDIFVKGGYEVTIYPTQACQDALRKTMSFTEDYDLLVCSGGDGTLDEVVTGMSRREKKIPIGYIPAGTTNDFAAGLQISKHNLEAARTAVEGVPFTCDVGAFNDDFFVYIAAFGLFTDVSYKTSQSRKNTMGYLAYLLEGAKRIFNIPSYHLAVTHDGEKIEDDFVYGMITNSRSVGGFKGITGPGVIFDDGVFEVTLIKTPKNPIEVNEIITSILAKQIDTRHMYSFKSGCVTFESEEAIPWTLDGEFGGTHKKVVIENKMKSLQIMINKDAKEQFALEKKEAEEK